MIDEAALALTASQHSGLFRRSDCYAAGMSRKVLARRVASGQYVERQPDVFQAASSPYDFEARERAALLAAGDTALLSHDSAGLRWSLGTAQPEDVWITLPFRHRLPRLEGVTVVRSRHTEGIRRSRDGWPLTSPPRTWVDLGRTQTSEQLESALATLLQKRLGTLAEIDKVFEMSHNKAGTGLARSVVAWFRPEWESYLSARFAVIMMAAGIELAPGHTIRDAAGSVLAVLDFADVKRRIAFEVDGWHFHGSKLQQQRDNKRDRMLLRLGWVTVRFTTDDILKHPERVVAEVIAILASRAA